MLTLTNRYKELGLATVPNTSDNGVHASASPFEGLVEKGNWLNMNPEDDSFGKALLNAGLSQKMISAWSIDPCVELPGGENGSIFDALEDLDVEDCLEKLIDINQLN